MDKTEKPIEITLEFLSFRVHNMRELQKQYFRGRNNEVLQKSKNAEREVDILVKQLMNPNKDQLEIF